VLLSQKIKRKARHLRELEDKRYQKQRKINKLKAKAKKEKQARVIAQRKAKIAEKRRKIAEKKAKAAEKKKQAIEKQRQVEAKKFKEEQRKHALIKASQLKAAQKIKDAQENILSELKVNYITQIASRVNSQWRYSGAKDDWTCEVHIVQDQGGVVKSVKLKSCNVNNKSRETSFKNSIIRAVNKASPLPSAPDKSLFERNIIFNFYQNRSLKK
jgi:colicin import membrane protein